MTAGFLVLCLPALPKLFKGSPWIQKFFTVLRSFSGSSNAGRSGEQLNKSNRSWPRFKPRRDPDASLFNDTQLSKQSFVPLTEVGSCNSEGRKSGSLVRIDVEK